MVQCHDAGRQHNRVGSELEIPGRRFRKILLSRGVSQAQSSKAADTFDVRGYR